MKLKLLVVLSVVFCMQAIPAFSQDKLKKWEPHGFLSLTYQEKYLGFRVSRNIYDDSILWSEAYLDLPGGFFTDLWWSTDLQDNEISSTGGDEIDPTLGWKGNICDFDVSVSATLFNIIPIGKWWHDDVWVQTFTLSKSYSYGKHTIRPEFRIEWLSEVDYFGGGSLVLMPNITHSWKRLLDIDELTFSHTTYLAWDDGFDMCKNDSDAVFLRWQGGLEWELSKNLKFIFPGLTVLAPIKNAHDGRGWEKAFNFAFVYKF